MYADDTRVKVRTGSKKLAAGKINAAIKVLGLSSISGESISTNVHHYNFPNGGATSSVIHIHLKISQTNINWENKVNYLCVILDSMLTYSAHINM
jgi:hypothetical protein